VPRFRKCFARIRALSSSGMPRGRPCCLPALTGPYCGACRSARPACRSCAPRRNVLSTALAHAEYWNAPARASRCAICSTAGVHDPGSFTVAGYGIRLTHAPSIHACVAARAGRRGAWTCHSDMPFGAIPCHHDRPVPQVDMGTVDTLGARRGRASRHPREVRRPGARGRSAARRPRGGRGRARSATRAATASAPFGPGSRRT